MSMRTILTTRTATTLPPTAGCHRGWRRPMMVTMTTMMSSTVVPSPSSSTTTSTPPPTSTIATRIPRSILTPRHDNRIRISSVVVPVILGGGSELGTYHHHLPSHRVFAKTFRTTNIYSFSSSSSSGSKSKMSKRSAMKKSHQRQHHHQHQQPQKRRKSKLGNQTSRKTRTRSGRRMIEPPKDYLSKLPKASLSQSPPTLMSSSTDHHVQESTSATTTTMRIPPMMLVPTASPFVYISQPALLLNNLHSAGTSMHGGGAAASRIDGGDSSSRSSNRHVEHDDVDGDDDVGGEVNVVKSESPDMMIDPSTLFAEAITPSLLTGTGTADATTVTSHLNDNNGNDDEGNDRLLYERNLTAKTTSSSSTSTNSSSIIPPMFERGRFEYFSPKVDFLDYDYPSDGKPEVAFLGRSNVGKSSLVNALMRSNLCITSKSPGRTRLPYYYGLTPNRIIQQRFQNNQKEQQHQLQRRWTSKRNSSKTKSAADRMDRKDPSQCQGFIVDLPGYGFGKAPKGVVESWQEQTQDWLLDRRHSSGGGDGGVLQRVFLLLDSRRGSGSSADGGGGPSELDLSVMSWLEEASIPYTIVLTKADRVSVPAVVRQVNDMCLRYAAAASVGSTLEDVPIQSPVVHVTSSLRGWGITELMLSVEAEFWTDERNDVKI